MFYIFIDESGVGKKTGRFVVVLVYVHVDNVDPLNRTVLEVEKEMGIEYFHWSHSEWKVRIRFIEAIRRERFITKIAFLSNTLLNNSAFENILGVLIEEKDIAAIIIDGKKSRGYEKRVKKVLGDKMVPIRKLKTGNDHGYPVLRVADAIAGLVRYRDEHPDHNHTNMLFKLIKKKIITVLEI